ncbi:translocation protein S66 [Ascosphaera aggregata]|nr:translocation protein S66 [Ascosphaera aggregata]
MRASSVPEKALSLKPWFGPHVQRDIYLSLVNYEPPVPVPGEKKPPRVPETVLKAALLRRAIEDVKRLLVVRNQKPALSSLLQKGSISDDVWQRFTRAEQELDSEIRDVVSEVRRFVLRSDRDYIGWGQGIFQTANEIIINVTMREKMQEIQDTAKEEREAWDKKTSEVQRKFMEEIGAQDGSSSKHAKKASAATIPDDVSIADSVTSNITSTGGANKKKKKGKK